MPPLVRQPRIRLATKAWLTTALILLGALGGTYLLARHLLRTSLEQELTVRISELFQRVRSEVGPRGWTAASLADPGRAPDLVSLLPEGAGAWLLAADGASVLDAVPEGSAPAWPDGLAARLLTVGGGTGWVEAAGERYLARGMRLTGRANEPAGLLVVGLPLGPPLRRRARAERRLLAGTVGAGILGVVLLGWLSRKLTRPLPDLMEASWRLGLGDFDHRAPVVTRDELGVMALTLNDAAATLKSSRTALRRAGRIEAWHQVARQVAHEIKNPLGGMRVAAENLRRAGQRDEELLRAAAGEAAEVVSEEVDALARLADAFSSLARLPDPEPQLLDMNHAVLHAAALARGEAEDGIEILTHLDEDLPPVWADETQVGQVLKNLLKNAVEAVSGPSDGSEGPPVSREEPAGRVVVATARMGAQVEVRVEDTGPGIPSSERERIFEPFVTSKAEGSGVGLSLSRQIVEAHGGSLAAISPASGDGAVFLLRLPVAEADLRKEPIDA